MVEKFSRKRNSKGEEVFGYIQGYCYEKGRGKLILPKGDIYLYEGKKQAFGASHIWMRHGSELQKKGFLNAEMYVESILKLGAEVYCEQSFPKLKPIILRRPNGVVILEYREKPFAHYSVITAYSAFLQHKIGNKIGNY